MSNWETLRKSSHASWTLARSLSFTTPADERTQWFFGFPRALVSQLLRHYHWGQYITWQTQSGFQAVNYLRPSTEEYYNGNQTVSPLPFTQISGVDSSYAGITTDGRLWTWGDSGTALFSGGSTQLGLGTNRDLVAPDADTASFGRPDKRRRISPQPVFGDGNNLDGVVFAKVIARTPTVALTSDGKLYCSGNGSSVFGNGDYYGTSFGVSATTSRKNFDYPMLVRNWGISYALVGNQVVGTPVETTQKVWTDFALSSDVLFGIADEGKIYRAQNNDSAALLRVPQTRGGSPYRVVITDAGAGYGTGPAITITTSPTGDNMTASLTIFSGGVETITVTNWGSGYTSAPTITIAEPSEVEKISNPGWRQATATVQVLPIDVVWDKIYGDTIVYALSSTGDLFRVSSGTFVFNFTFDRLADGVVFTKVAPGGGSTGHLVALDEDGAVWTLGDSNNGTSSARSTLQVLDSGPWIDIAAGTVHGVMLNADGEVWTWGQNSAGQLGLGDTTARTTPVKIPCAAKFKAIFAGGNSTMAIRDENDFDVYGNPA